MLQEYSGAMVESALQLTRLVDDMTNLRYLEAGGVALNLLPLQLQELVIHEVDQFRQVDEGKDHVITCEAGADLPSVRADAERIGLVLGNLLSNASKFTPPGGRIQVLVQPHDDKVMVAVQDTGCGIPREEWEHIFEPFYQVGDSLRRKHGGMGLGLSIARELVLLHGGTIWVESEVGRGSTFYFTLPQVEAGAS